MGRVMVEDVSFASQEACLYMDHLSDPKCLLLKGLLSKLAQSTSPGDLKEMLIYVYCYSALTLCRNVLNRCFLSVDSFSLCIYSDAGVIITPSL